MPSSGARSGTRPSRSERGAGTGSAGKRWRLDCGHTSTPGQLPLALTIGVRFYVCPECAAVARAKP